MTRMIRLGIISTAVVERFKERYLEPPKKILELYFTNKDVCISNQSEYDKLSTLEQSYASSLIAKFCILKPSDKKFKIEALRYNYVGEIDKSKSITDECLYNLCNINTAFSTLDDKRIYFNTLLQGIKNNYGDQISKQLTKDLVDFQKNITNVYGENFMCIKFKPGTRVICTVNAKEDGEILYANGTSGIIERCENDFIILNTDDKRMLQIEYKTIEYTRRLSLDQDLIIDLKFSFRHIPLRLGYAMSLCRSQGLTLDTVRVSGKGLRKSTGLIYVGLSRCRSLDNMYLHELDINKIFVSSLAIEKFQGHYCREIQHLKSIRPEWFKDYYINTDSPLIVQKMNHVIALTEQVPLSLCIENIYDTSDDTKTFISNLSNNIDISPDKMPIILSDTKHSYITESRGSSQNRLRTWLIQTQKVCLVTQEAIPDLLEAAHIKEYSLLKDTELAHQNNAVLLRLDIHKLFDKGYLTFDIGGNVLLSKSLKDKSEYCKYSKVKIPEFIDLEYIGWHNQNIFDPDK